MINLILAATLLAPQSPSLTLNTPLTTQITNPFAVSQNVIPAFTSINAPGSLNQYVFDSYGSFTNTFVALTQNQAQFRSSTYLGNPANGMVDGSFTINFNTQSNSNVVFIRSLNQVPNMSFEVDTDGDGITDIDVAGTAFGTYEFPKNTNNFNILINWHIDTVTELYQFNTDIVLKVVENANPVVTNNAGIMPDSIKWDRVGDSTRFYNSFQGNTILVVGMNLLQTPIPLNQGPANNSIFVNQDLLLTLDYSSVTGNHIDIPNTLLYNFPSMYVQGFTLIGGVIYSGNYLHL